MEVMKKQTKWVRILLSLAFLIGLFNSLAMLSQVLLEHYSLTLGIGSLAILLWSQNDLSEVSLTPDQMVAFSLLKQRAMERIYNNGVRIYTDYYTALGEALSAILSEGNQDYDSLLVLSLNSIVNKIAGEVIENSLAGEDPELFVHNQSRSSYYKYLLEEIIMAHKPKSAPLSNKERGKSLGGRRFLNVDNPRFTEQFLRENHVQLPQGKVRDLKDNHAAIVKKLRQLPLPLKNFFNGKGIVIPSSAAFLPGALVTIGQLREMGSKLPIEVILNYESDYDKEMCEVLLPKLNTECIVMEREFTPEFMKSLKLKQFQLKSLSMLVSKFDHTIWLDADNAPIKNVDKLLESDPYLETKFLLWPDFWHLGVSPLYYEISGREIGEVVRREGLRNKDSWEEYLKLDKAKGVAFSDLQGTNPGQSVETGQIAFSKVEHFRALLLAIYYNLFGVSHYYRLLFQGIYGEGDRETFVPALEAMKEPYFLSPYNVWFVGYTTENKGFMETTIVQHDPDQAYHYTKKWRAWLKRKGLDTRLSITESDPYSRTLRRDFLNDHKLEKLETPEVMFLHIHKPKINPVANTDTKVNNHGIYTRRNLGKPGKYKDLKGKDWELKLHSIAKWVACDFLNPSYWEQLGKDQEQVCSGVSKYVDFLKKDTNDPDSEKLKILPKLIGNRVSDDNS